jgi:hypothetical protein
LHFLSRPRRPLRSGEWTPTKAVTFIVTLAASRSVTLAAREAGMSRKSAYGLKARDPAFSAAWAAAAQAGARVSRNGDKVEEVAGVPNPPAHGYTSPSRIDHLRVLAGLVARLRESPPLADLPPAQ